MEGSLYMRHPFDVQLFWSNILSLYSGKKLQKFLIFKSKTSSHGKRNCKSDKSPNLKL